MTEAKYVLGRGRIFFGTDPVGMDASKFELTMLVDDDSQIFDRTYRASGTFVAGAEFEKFKRKLFGRWLRVRHKATGEPAIAMRRPDGLLLVQFNWLKHPHAYGWHLYPRHHFTRRRGK